MRQVVRLYVRRRFRAENIHISALRDQFGRLHAAATCWAVVGGLEVAPFAAWLDRRGYVLRGRGGWLCGLCVAHETGYWPKTGRLSSGGYNCKFFAEIVVTMADSQNRRFVQVCFVQYL